MANHIFKLFTDEEYRKKDNEIVSKYMVDPAEAAKYPTLKERQKLEKERLELERK